MDLTSSPSVEIMRFVETQILPRYTHFDKAHNLTHVNSVIKRSVDMARQMGADINMAYVIAAYHDLGLEGPRAIHHLTSRRILSSDARLRKWFTPEQIHIMSEAVEDHRASASHAPRSLYGKIVAEADRDITTDNVIRRTIQFGKSKHSELSREQQWQRFRQHMESKYSRNGYIKLWLHGTENERNLNTLRQIIDNPAQLKAHFDRIYDTI